MCIYIYIYIYRHGRLGPPRGAPHPRRRGHDRGARELLLLLLILLVSYCIIFYRIVLYRRGHDRGVRRGTNGLSTNGVAGIFIFLLTEGPFGYSR